MTEPNLAQISTFDIAKKHVEFASEKGGFVGQESVRANAWATLAVAEALGRIADLMAEQQRRGEL